ncbi:MAG TPA: MFS transporter [Alphaproteobacteria bacterium]|nr:MFS transporter [Alphaproteobacteria bacterium]
MKKVITSTMIGNGLEWYDYALYGLFAALISKHFFPESDATVNLIKTYGIFAAGFLMRPLGAVFFGYFGDKYGRKNTLALSILMMAIPTACIGFLPTYNQIGVWAPVALVIIRLLQGIAIGGEFGGSIVYLVEHSGEKHRNLIGSTSIISMLIGVLLGSFLSAFLAQIMSEENFNQWGWRIPFILGLVFGLIGLYIRTHLDESPVFLDAKEAGHLSDKPVIDTLKENNQELLLAIGAYFAVTIPFYIQTVFMNSFMVKFIGFTVSDAFLINTISLLVMMVAVPISAFYCDKGDRERILKIVCVVYVVFAFPFLLMLESNVFIYALLAQVMFATIIGFYIAPIPTLLSDIFPCKTRFTGMSLSCNIAAAIFGGTTPILITWSIGYFGNNYFMSTYIIFAAVVSFYSVKKIKTKSHYNI